MKILPNSPAPSLTPNRTEAEAFLKRTAAFCSRFLAPSAAADEVLLVGLTILLGLSLGLATSRAGATEPKPAPDADGLILQSHAFVAGVPSFEIGQTKVEKITPLKEGKPIGPARSQTTSLVIRTINSDPMVSELITADAAGRPMRVIRRGERVAMKLGTEPWQVPSGPYAQLKDQLATPYACPLPGHGNGSPQWQVVSSDQERGEACDVVETVGNSAVGYVTGVMNKALSLAFPDPEARPAIQLNSYVSRHWIAPNAKRLRVEQTARMQMTLRPPNGEEVQMDVESTTNARYREYGAVTIEIPAEAERLLAVPVAKL